MEDNHLQNNITISISKIFKNKIKNAINEIENEKAKLCQMQKYGKKGIIFNIILIAVIFSIVMLFLHKNKNN